MVRLATTVRIICVDFDGVLHSYTSGWQGPRTIPDAPIPGALEWLFKLINADGIKPVIYSSRSKAWGGRRAMRRWLREHYAELIVRSTSLQDREDIGTARMASGALERASEIVDALDFPANKPAAFLTIDDRAFCFQGRFPDAKEIALFKPWKTVTHAC